MLSCFQIDVYDEDVSSRNDLIGSTVLSLADMFRLATSNSGVELYRKGKYRGMLFVTQCQVEQPVDMVDKDGKQGYVSTYPPRKKLNISASLPASWSDTTTYLTRPHQLPNPTYPNQPPSNISLRSSKIPPNYQVSYKPLTAAAQAMETNVRSVSNPEGMTRRKLSSSLHDQVLRKASQGASKVSQGASKISLGSLGNSLEKFGQNNSLGALGSLVHRATSSKKGWSLGDQLDRLTKK
jgi:hypothetical protein